MNFMETVDVNCAFVITSVHLIIHLSLQLHIMAWNKNPIVQYALPIMNLKGYKCNSLLLL